MTGRRSLASAAAAVIAVLAGPVPANASAQLPWLKVPASSGLMADGLPGTVDTSAGPDGSVLVVWTEDPGSIPTDPSHVHRLRMYKVMPNGKAGPAVAISDTGGNAFTADVARQADGSGAIAWTQENDSGRRLVKFQRFNAALKMLGAPIDVSDPSTSAVGPKVALAPDGTATIGWTMLAPNANRGAIVRVSPSGSVTSPYPTCALMDSEVGKSTLAGCSGLSVVTAKTGASISVWRETLTAADSSTYSRIVTRWIGPNDVSRPTDRHEISTLTGQTVGDPVLALGSDGAALAVWNATDPVSHCPPAPSACPGYLSWSRLDARRLPANGDAGTRKPLTEADLHTYHDVLRSTPSIAADSSGGYLVTWVDMPGVTGPSGSVVQYRRVSKSGTPGSRVRAVADSPAGSSIGHYRSSAIFLGSEALIGWSSDDSQIRYVTVPKSDVVGRAAVITGPARFNREAPELARSSDGTLAATWFSGDPGTKRLRTQFSAVKAATGSIKFPAKLKKGAKSGRLSFKSSKYGTVSVQFAPASPKLKVAKRVTKVRGVLKAGTNAVTFDTRGVKKGIYRVTVTFTDLAGLVSTASAKLIVTR